MTTLDDAARHPPDRADRLRRLCREARRGPARRRARGPRRRRGGAPDAALIAGLTPPDDAAAYRVSDDLAIIGTLDFFPPLVDDPRTFGEIAAANALSRRVRDGRPRPVRPVDRGLPRGPAAGRAGGDLRGRLGKVREAGGTLAGGHTIRDPEPKYGLAVIGAGHPDKLLRKGGAQPGDALILTKRLGTGRARQRQPPGPDRAPRTWPPPSTRCARSTAPPSEVLVARGVRAATDVTGFGLLGHGLEMARGAGRPVRVRGRRRCPPLPGALELAAAGVETGGAAHNRRFVAPALTVGNVVPPAVVPRPRSADLRRPAGRGRRPRTLDDTIRRSTRSASRPGGSAGSRPATGHRPPLDQPCGSLAQPGGPGAAGRSVGAGRRVVGIAIRRAGRRGDIVVGEQPVQATPRVVEHVAGPRRSPPASRPGRPAWPRRPARGSGRAGRVAAAAAGPATLRGRDEAAATPASVSWKVRRPSSSSTLTSCSSSSCWSVG